MEIIRNLFKANFFTTGLAMFAMFFGSGNLVFPVAMGQMAGVQNAWAMLGLFITAVLLPFSTLCLMLLYNGNYDRFFQKIGIIPGKIVAFATLALIGPFGVLPRCIAFSYSTFSIYFSSISLFEYSLVACIIVFLLSAKENDVVGIIGNFLTPFLLLSLAFIIFKGLSADPIMGDNVSSGLSNLEIMKTGFFEGYKTFDIFAALFFSSAIIPAFHSVLGKDLGKCKKALVALAVKSSLVGMGLLFAVYCGLSFVAANLRGALADTPGDKLLGIIANLTIGTGGGLTANTVVSLACLTTAISLAVVSAEFFKQEIFRNKINYVSSLSLVMIISLFFSLLGFDGIMRMVIPILMVICPAVITLIVVNALNFFWGFKYIRVPVYGVFVISLGTMLFC
jgi:LIVCS family branched-chain amino acid:cation transporter